MNDFVVISARSSGLGDMLNQLVHLMWYAECTERRCLVDWSGSKNYLDFEESDIFSEFFESDFVSSVNLEDDFFWKNLNPIFSDKLPDRIAQTFEPAVVERFSVLGKDVSSKIVRLRRPIDFLPLHFLSIYYNQIKIREHVKAGVDKHSAFKEKKLVGVHIRHGNGELYDKVQEKNLLEGFHKEISLKMAEHPDAKFFLATDSKFIEEWFEANFGYFYCLNKYLPEEFGSPLHQLTSTKNAASVNRRDVFLEALLDMYALSKCSYLICDAWSSFTRASRAWGGFDYSSGTLVSVPVPRKPVTG